jgi:hypothetical protein
VSIAGQLEVLDFEFLLLNNIVQLVMMRIQKVAIESAHYQQFGIPALNSLVLYD